jgi:uncharacterized protein (DUF2267 family)
VGQVDDDRFLSIVEREAGVDREAAVETVRVTLTTLAQRVKPGPLREVQRQAPELVRPLLSPKEPRELYDAAGFVAHVAERLGVDEETARRRARAVFVALSRAVSLEAWQDVVRELPMDYAPLLAGSLRSRVPMPLAEFLDWVTDRGGIDRETARRASEAVLETLGERITGGEVDDLLKELTPELRPPLERGRERSGGRAQKMSLEEFVGRIAEREGVPVEEARAHARAVMNTIRDAVVAKEWRDVGAQLPRRYLEELAEP